MGEFDILLRTATARPDDADALSDLARAALGRRDEEAALPLIVSATERHGSALLWQWRALLERALDEHERSLASFAKATALAPEDRSIAHGHARVALEAGVPAVALFERALRLAPADGAVMLGYVASLFAAGEAGAAESLLQDVLSRSPLWIEGQVQLAHLRAICGKRAQARAFLEATIEKHPNNESLWSALFGLLVQSEEFEALDQTVSLAKSHLPTGGTLVRYETIAAVERGDQERAEGLFAVADAHGGGALPIYRIRHLLRTGNAMGAAKLIDSALKTDAAADVWPYAAIAWRLTGDPRAGWLEGRHGEFVSVVDLTSDLPSLPALELALRKLHVGRGEYLDQSVRGGSQTDGPLFSNIDPAIRLLRAAVVRAVERYTASLPEPRAGHPLLGAPRGRRVRFAGSWSVLLRGGGYHANHVHPRGWISSAFYVRVPERNPGEAPHAGWLAIGEPQSQLGINLSPLKQVEPRPGCLVLFPSTMWHGTRPFASGERMTVAFDVERPH